MSKFISKTFFSISGDDWGRNINCCDKYIEYFNTFFCCLFFSSKTQEHKNDNYVSNLIFSSIFNSFLSSFKKVRNVVLKIPTSEASFPALAIVGL